MPKIAIITDSLLSAGTASILKRMLSRAGITSEDYSIIPVFPLEIEGEAIRFLGTTKKEEAADGFPFLNGSPRIYLDARHAIHLGRMWKNIERCAPNVLLVLGNIPMLAICGEAGIVKKRGAPRLSSDQRYKVIPTYDPKMIIKQWKLMPIAQLDIEKCVRQSSSPLLVRPSRYLHLDPTLPEIADFYQTYIVPASILSVDVETKAGQITEVGIAPSRSRAIVIPFWSRAQRDGNYWRTLDEELQAWAWVRRILSEKPTLGQNFQYDVQYFYRTVGIPVPQFTDDTMLLHHSLQPELEKGLGFLASIYTDEPSWKFMRTIHDTLKKED